MAFGDKARDPSTPYLVYAFVWRERVFYIGLAPAESTRHTHRWSFVKNLVRHEVAGTLKPDKRRELERTSNAILAALIKADLEPHEVRVLWRGIGRAAAETEEQKQIALHLSQGCVLGNIQGMAAQSSVSQVLQYLGAKSAAS